MDVLCGDEQVEIDGEVLGGSGEEVAIDVGEHAEFVSRLETGEGVVGVGPDRPIGERVREGVFPFFGQVEVESLGEAAERFCQHISIELKSLKFDVGFDAEVGVEEFGVVGACDIGDGGPDAGFPVDERAVAVEGDPLDVVADVV